VTQATQCLRGCALFRDKVPSDKQLDGTKAVHTLGPPPPAAVFDEEAVRNTKVHTVLGFESEWPRIASQKA